MFDLDLIEKDYNENSFRLSEEEIIEIYKSEKVCLSEVDKESKKYRDEFSMSTEERLLLLIFGEGKKIEEREEKLYQKLISIKKDRLSKEKQRIVVEGSLWLVFDETRYWHNVFNGEISMEKIYYICLEALMNSVKYIVHCEKPIFRFYILKSIKRNIIKYISKWEHITYREAYDMVNNLKYYKIIENSKDMKLLDIGEGKKELSFNYDNDKVEKPSKIYYRLKNESFYVDYIKNISSDEFLRDYKLALNTLTEDEKSVMQMSFDIDGERGMTSMEIAEYLGLNAKKVDNIRSSAYKKLKKNKKLNNYLQS